MKFGILPSGLRRGVGRVARLAVVGALVLTGTTLATGTAQAQSWFEPIDASGFKLELRVDTTGDIASGYAANPTLTRTDLSAVTDGAYAKNGLCFPEPIHPGAAPNGYCWDNTADDSGSDGKAPQGFALPHTETTDGWWRGKRWEVVSWHGPEKRDASNNPIPDPLQPVGNYAKVRFVDRSLSTPRYFDVFLATLAPNGAVTASGGTHGDSVVWYKDNLLVGSGKNLEVFRLADLMRVSGAGPKGLDFVLPVAYTYRSTAVTSSSCTAATGNEPCLTSLSLDRANGALLSSEWMDKEIPTPGRIVRWPFDLATGLPKSGAPALGAWLSPIRSMQGAVNVQGTFYVSGICPAAIKTGYRESACIHKAAPGGYPSVVTAVPDMTQNFDYDPPSDRFRGVNEVAQSSEALPQRLVFDFARTPSPITTVRFRNVNSGKCLLPYGGSLNNGTNVVQWTCDDNTAESWYWVGDTIRQFHSKKCLTVYGGSTSDGAVLNEWTCNGSTAQSWTKVAGTAGGATLRNVNSGKCITIYGGSIENNAVATQWTCQGGNVAHNWIGYTP
ncbi:RICIN domain-containing protein [Streptomyces sp. NPDC048603]|uniref:RICIN domain-containing protein n=1 Tax=Streptomyces sp. NPDC048603 TaxID=3365577 RepID=UPI003720F64A